MTDEKERGEGKEKKKRKKKTKTKQKRKKKIKITCATRMCRRLKKSAHIVVDSMPIRGAVDDESINFVSTR